LNLESIQSIFVASAVLMAMLAIARPHWLLRPSFAFACVMTIVINPAAAFVMKDGYPDSPLFDSFRLSSVVFPLGIVAWTACTPFLSDVARNLRISCRDAGLVRAGAERSDRIIMWTGIAACGLLTVWYLSVVPIRSTGMWSIIFSNGNATLAREESLKLLDSVALKYAYSFGTTVLAVTTLILLALQVTYRRALSSAAILISIIGLLTLIGITGARMPMAKAILAVAIAYALTARTRSQLLVLPAGLAGAIAIVTSLTLWRSGKELFDASISMSQGIIDRAFVLPFETGLHTVQFAADRGFLAGANIRPYAAITGQPHIVLPSEVYHAFYFFPSQGSIESGSANTCFFFDFQAGFGIWPGWLIALMAIGMVDFSLLAFPRVRGRLRPALLAVLLMGVFSLASSAFSTALLTGGIGLTVAIAIWWPILVHAHSTRINQIESATASAPERT
jgi:hypothetical protein